VSEQVYDQVSDQVSHQVSDQVSEQVREQVSDQVHKQVYDQVSEQVYDQVSEQVYDQVSDQVSHQVSDQVSEQVREQVSDQGINYYNFSYYGNITDYFWLAFYDYVNYIGIIYDKQKELDLFKSILHTGIYDMLQFKNLCLVCSKPILIHRDINNRLHSTQGAAIEYKDGYKLWFLHGVSVEPEIFEPNFDISQVLQEKNAEKRWRLVEFFGMDRLLNYCEYEIIDITDIEISGTINHYDLVHLHSPIEAKYLKMKNPSTGTIHIEGVHPDCCIVQDALNFRRYGKIEAKQINWLPQQLT
jgi:hypothetical protein